jgi:hypothetical protein
MRLNVWRTAETKQSAVSAMAPAREIVDGAPDLQDPSAGLALRHLLRMIAYDPRVGTHQHALARLRPFVDGARLESRRRHEADGRSDDHVRRTAQLLDGAVSGLCHVARFCADGAADSVVAPFAAVAVSLPGPGGPSSSAALDLLFVVPENVAVRERADRMVAFVLAGLSELGFSVTHASVTPASAALLTEAVPSFAGSLHNLRFVWGWYGLYADLAGRFPKPDRQS